MNYISRCRPFLYAPRVWARLRSLFPLLPFLIGLLLGQFFACVARAYVVFLLTGIIILYSIWMQRRPRLAGIWAGSIAGALSMLCSFASSPTIPQTSATHFALVDAAPRYRQVGEIELSLKILPPPLNQEGEERSRVLCRGVHLPWRNSDSIVEGDYVFFQGSFRGFIDTWNPFIFDSAKRREGYTASCKIEYLSSPSRQKPKLWRDLREWLGDRVRKRLGNNEASGLFLSMTLGTRDSISKKTEDAFKRVGLAHLLVVSGFQVTLIFVLALGITRVTLSLLFPRFLLCGVKNISVVIGVLFSIAFVLLSGVEGPAVRASLSVIFFVSSKFFERGSGYLGSLISSLLTLCCIWPGCFLEPGVQLTFAALIGIGLATHSSPCGKIRVYLRVCFLSSLCTSLICLLWFGTFSLIGFVTNPLFAGLVSFFSCYVGVFALLLELLHLDSSAWLLRGCAESLLLFRDLVISLADLPLVSFELSGISRILLIGLLSLLILECVAKQFYCFACASQLQARLK